ncbi:hypothetical protein [Pseudobutyrivibrio sp. LB2011]|nr:hypothetical protein [Pseudobutyrivibrio sp. LB2011]
MLVSKISLVVNKILSVLGIDGNAPVTPKDFLVVAVVCAAIGIAF